MKIKMTIGRMDLEDGWKAPYGYGMAYYDIERGTAVLYPLGIHWVVMALRGLMFWYWRAVWWRPKSQRKFESRLRRIARKRSSWGYGRWMKELKEAEKRGYDRGFRDVVFCRELDMDYTKGPNE